MTIQTQIAILSIIFALQGLFITVVLSDIRDNTKAIACASLNGDIEAIQNCISDN